MDDVNWEGLARGFVHPLRVSILIVLGMDGGRTLSPKELSRELQEELGKTSAHVRALREAGLVGRVREARVRGATEHFHRSVKADKKQEEGREDESGTG